MAIYEVSLTGFKGRIQTGQPLAMTEQKPTPLVYYRPEEQHWGQTTVTGNARSNFPCFASTNVSLRAPQGIVPIGCVAHRTSFGR
jgi:hypothetical protein